MYREIAGHIDDINNRVAIAYLTRLFIRHFPRLILFIISAVILYLLIIILLPPILPVQMNPHQV